MKKIILILSFILVTIGAIAQEKTYVAKCKTNDGHFDVSVSRQQGVIRLYLSTIAAKEHYPAATELEMQEFLIVGEKNILAFISSLSQVRNKYIEWTEVAHKNDVHSLTKGIDISFPEVSLQWTSMNVRRYQNSSTPNPTYRDSHVKLQAVYVLNDNEWIETFFKYKKNVPYITFSGIASSNSNQYITTKYAFCFSSVSEIDAFISSIQIDSLKEKLNKVQARDDLFK